MINFLRSWCEGIMISVFITIVIEMLVPAGNIKKYVQVIIGIYIVFVILNPVISNLDKINLEDFFNSKNYTEETFSSNNDEMINIYTKAIETEIKEKFTCIDSVKVTFSDDLESIEKIEIILEDSAININDIKKFLKETYKVSDNCISIIS